MDECWIATCRAREEGLEECVACCCWPPFVLRGAMSTAFYMCVSMEVVGSCARMGSLR